MKYPMIQADETGETMFGIREIPDQETAFGVNWYSKTHWRFMANLIKVRAKDGPFGDQKPWIVQVRGQYYF